MGVLSLMSVHVGSGPLCTKNTGLIVSSVLHSASIKSQQTLAIDLNGVRVTFSLIYNHAPRMQDLECKTTAGSQKSTKGLNIGYFKGNLIIFVGLLTSI